MDEAIVADANAALEKHHQKYVNYFVGQAMKANPNFSPQIVRKIVDQKLKEIG